MDAIKSGFSCPNIFLYCFPQIVNILLTIWKCVGSVLLKILPLTLYSSFICLLKIVLNLIYFELSSITFILQLPSAAGVESLPAHQEVAAPLSTMRGHCSHSLYGLGECRTNPSILRNALWTFFKKKTKIKTSSVCFFKSKCSKHTYIYVFGGHFINDYFRC